MINYSDFEMKRKFAFETIIPSLLANHYEDKAKKMMFCGHWKEIAHCRDCQTNYLTGFNSCKQRFCPLCEAKRSRLWFARLVPIVEDLLNQGYYLNMCTLTIPDMESLEKSKECLCGAWRILTHQDRNISKEYKARFVGGVRTFETKRGENSKLWHSHFHLIVVKDKMSRDFEWLQKAWSKCVSLYLKKDTYCNIDIRGFKYGNRVDLISNVLETTKYIAKFDWEIGNDIQELISVLTGVRSITTFGILRKMLKENDIENDMNLSLTDVEKIVCSVCGNEDFDIIEGVTSKNLVISDFKQLKELRNERKSRVRNFV